MIFKNTYCFNCYQIKANVRKNIQFYTKKLEYQDLFNFFTSKFIKKI